MPVNTRKIRSVVKKIQNEMKSDPNVRAKVMDNHIQLLNERGLTFAEIKAAHEMEWCKGTTGICNQSLSLFG